MRKNAFSISHSQTTMQNKAKKRVSLILQKSSNIKFPNKEFDNFIRELPIIKKNRIWTSPKFQIGILILILFALFYYWRIHEIFINESKCLIEMPQDASKIFREPENCNICKNVTQVDRIQNVSDPYNFYKKYIESCKPVVVTDAAKFWPALDKFSFPFFKELYKTAELQGETSRSNCQFFPYKTEFKSLQEVLDMKIERALLQNGEKPWYIGWSNCNDYAGKILRKYYENPYFLPNTSENIGMSWLFMGSPGYGAHMHVDNVQYPSWQAQIKGRKSWRLAPPPECYYICQEMFVSVNPGEIIVVDTNRWYHQTFVLPGEISITIGAEFD